MSKLVILAVLMVLGFIGSVFGYSYFKEISVQEATKVIKSWLFDIYKALRDNEKPKPVLRLGTIDGFNYTVEKIHLVFGGVMELFRTCFYQAHQENKHYIVYQFKAKYTQVDFEPLALLDLISSIVEQEVNKVLHENNIFVNTASFVAVDYDQTILTIFVAKNEDGFAEIEEIKAKVQARNLSFDDGEEQMMAEDWENL